MMRAMRGGESRRLPFHLIRELVDRVNLRGIVSIATRRCPRFRTVFSPRIFFLPFSESDFPSHTIWDATFT